MPRRARWYIGSVVTSSPLKTTWPSLGVIWPGGHAEAGRLAGAVGPEQADDFAGVHLERHAVDDGTTAVEFDQPPHFQQRHNGNPLGNRR